MARATTSQTVRNAKVLRRDMSLPEVMLWRVLRTKPEGIKFRRQHPLGPYVLDFYCATAKLAIEIDGIAHDMGDRPERDEQRDMYLESKGLRMVRIPASEVLNEVGEVADMIIRLCHSPSTIGRADGPPPHALREREGL
jgi:very-short-patch-repair endonuclease